jgi:hypothetical protein
MIDRVMIDSALIDPATIDAAMVPPGNDRSGDGGSVRDRRRDQLRRRSNRRYH